MSEPFIVRNILRTRFLDALQEKAPGAHILLLTLPHLAEELRREFAHGGVSVEVLTPFRNSLADKLLDFISRNGFSSGTVQVMQHRAWSAGESKIPPFVKRLFAATIGKVPGFVALVRFLDSHIATAPQLAAFFEKHQPALILSTVLQHRMDTAIVREAKRRSVRSLGMVRSWDNLTGFGYLRAIPDIFIAQCDFIRDMAVQYQRINTSRIHVTGLPHYDLYRDPSRIVPREQFCNSLGLDPAKKIVLYGAIGEFLFRHEAGMASTLDTLVANGSIAAPAQVIFRPHPAFPMHERLSTLAHVALDESQLDSFDHLINTLHHADVLVTAGSTLIVDAACFNTPSVSVAFDGAQQEANPWFSVARFYEYFTHLRVLLQKTYGTRIAPDVRALATEINAYIADRSRDAKGRKEIVAYFAAPLDGHSGERMAQVLVDNLRSA